MAGRVRRIMQDGNKASQTAAYSLTSFWGIWLTLNLSVNLQPPLAVTFQITEWLVTSKAKGLPDTDKFGTYCLLWCVSC
jgi:hypothetical protein